MAGARTILEREVLRGQRRWQTFAWRFAFVGVLLALFLAEYDSTMRWHDWADPSELAWVGERLFEWTMYGQWWLLGLLTPILVAQGIVEERSQGTLELLAISRISPARLLAGKVLSSLTNVGFLVLAGMPLVALALSFGGVSVESLVLAYGALLVGVLTVASLAAYFALFAKGPIGPLVMTWASVFLFWLLMGLPAIVIADRESLAFSWFSVAYVFFEGIDDPELTMLWPLVLWTGLSLVILRLASQVFVTLIASSGGEDHDAALLSADIWAIERIHEKQGLRWLVLMGTVMVPLAIGYLGLRGLVLLAGFAWFLLLLYTVVMAVLLRSRQVLLRIGSRRAARRLSRSEQAALVDGERRRGQRPPGAREVWGNPVAWREIVTGAHGFLSTVVGRVYIAGLLAFGVAVAFSHQVDDEFWAVTSIVGYLAAALIAVLVAVSSMVGDRHRGTLALLCVTPLGARRILRGKLLGVLVHVLPVFAVSTFAGLLGASQWVRRHSWGAAWDSGDPAKLLWRMTSNAWIAFAGILFLVVQSLYLAPRMRTPTRAWLACLAAAAALAIVPGVVLATFDHVDFVEEAVAWFNPVFSEAFWDEVVSDRAGRSGLLWIGASLLLLRANARSLERVVQ